MAAERNQKHIEIGRSALVEAYTPYGRPIEASRPPAPQSRRSHGRELAVKLETARDEAIAARSNAPIAISEHPGVYIQFQSIPGFDLKLESMENRRRGIEVVSVRNMIREGFPVELATVFVPEGQVGYFLSRFETYANDEPRRPREQRHEDLVDRIADIRRATLQALWTDDESVYPQREEPIWWEVWLRRHDGTELERLYDFASAYNCVIGERRIQFDERIVVTLLATPAQLASSISVLNDLAEIRLAKEPPTFFVDLTTIEQEEWVEDLKSRLASGGDDDPVICILDTGVTRTHPLLEKALPALAVHSLDPAWGTGDHHGHGTEMAGLALIGDLANALQSHGPIVAPFTLESVKILPPTGANPPQVWGALTAEAAYRVEVAAPNKPRTFSMAVASTDERDRGQPTSWSASIDALAIGRSFDASSRGLEYVDVGSANRRLFVIAAGNVETYEEDHISRSDVEPVHDPGQAWNALTVGAFTNKDLITDQDFAGWSPVAQHGDLSPYSTTSVAFDSIWPIKPDVVFEGGNTAHDSAGNVDIGIPELSLLSTYFRHNLKPFVTTFATSAACAQVSRIAGIIFSEYPTFWPETVRGLIVHSARWTRAMNRHLSPLTSKRARGRIIRRYGFGTPSVQRALRSAADAVTLIVQDVIRPFETGRLREMHIHALPWPVDILAELGDSPVRMRVTLSYFIEPNPGRRGWKRKYRYASHGLRFDVKGATESLDEFRKRLNSRALSEEERRPSDKSHADGWYVGEENRNRGSIHSDLWIGTAADLAERGFIAVYPVSGWWKDQHTKDRSAHGCSYSLVVSIETDEEDVDIYAAVQAEVEVQTVIEI